MLCIFVFTALLKSNKALAFHGTSALAEALNHKDKDSSAQMTGSELAYRFLISLDTCIWGKLG